MRVSLAIGQYHLPSWSRRIEDVIMRLCYHLLEPVSPQQRLRRWVARAGCEQRDGARFIGDDCERRKAHRRSFGCV